MKIRVIKHEVVPDCGSYEVRFPDGVFGQEDGALPGALRDLPNSKLKITLSLGNSDTTHTDIELFDFPLRRRAIFARAAAL